VDAGLPTPSGTTYEYALPALPEGQWQVKVRACYGADCQDSAVLSVVKMVPAGSTALNYYWVSPTGAAASWAACKSDTPLSGAEACSLDRANLNIAAGQTVFLRGGTYDLAGGNNYDCGVSPQASGTLDGTTCTAPITYRAHPNETPVITTAVSWLNGIQIVSQSCVRVFGMTVTNIAAYYGYLRSAHYNEIAYNTLTATTTAGEVGSGLYLNSSCTSAYDCWNTHNWIHHNTIEKRRNGQTCGEGTDLIRIGDDDSEIAGADMTAANNYNTITDNELRYASHTPLETYGNYQVIARNYIHNEPWWVGDDATCNYPNDTYDNNAFNGKYGHRSMQVTDGYDRDSTYSLVESNRVGGGSVNPGNNGADGMDIAAPRAIVRHNDIYGAMNSCLMFKYGWEYATTGNGGTYNKAYNNSLHHCGYGNGSFYELEYAACVAAGGLNCSTTPQALLAVRWYVSETVGNVLKNNIFSDTRRYVLTGHETGYGASTPGSPTGTVLSNNWGGAQGVPAFTDTTVTAASRTQPNLALQAASGAIDGATYLTQANGASDGDETPSVTLVVDDGDAWYFQDGTWGSNLTRTAGVMFPDWIAVGTVSNVAQISSINYATHTITLASPLTWADNANVWLYKKSDGVLTLVGAAPDYGAHECGIGTSVAPTGVVVR
jgi:hypothetical protein